jgi:hypothetical protein
MHVIVGDWSPYVDSDGHPMPGDRVAGRLYFESALPDAAWSADFNRRAAELGDQAPAIVMRDHIEVMVASDQERAVEAARQIIAATNQS